MNDRKKVCSAERKLTECLHKFAKNLMESEN